MNEKQAIEELAIDYLATFFCTKHKDGKADATRILDKLRSLGLLRTGEEVELDPDQTLPPNPFPNLKSAPSVRTRFGIGYDKAQRDVLKAGFKKVRELTHKEEWKDKPDSIGTYWILYFGYVIGTREFDDRQLRDYLPRWGVKFARAISPEVPKREECFFTDGCPVYEETGNNKCHRCNANPKAEVPTKE